MASALELTVARRPAWARDQAEDFRNGRDKIKGFFVGQIMKSSGGRANPAIVEELLMARLRKPQ
jgi:aspartyl-tRNA(Asn)/glutamyl-tRNA(Gln) amidotransferase subunit B